MDPVDRPPPAPRTGSQVIELALEAVRREGGRSTTTRRIVLEALVDAGEPGVTAEDLADHIREQHPTFTSSTIYRCLERFEELGVISHAHMGHGPAVWRLIDQPRWYLVCTSCGKSMDADPTLVERLSSQLLRTVGFRLDGHFALTGRCA
ncbi:MAG TPA: transcriptional repressor, partial [Acidimicrobiales bacterium]|nr:transcriptional repressor [Acidimicrobiales bacterium]